MAEENGRSGPQALEVHDRTMSSTLRAYAHSQPHGERYRENGQ